MRFGKRKVILDKMKKFLIYIIFLLTMLGTSTASGNVREGKTCVIFTSALFALFSSVAYLVAKVQGTRENSHTNFAFAFKLSNYCVNFSFKSVRASLICLGKSGCREIFSSWPQLVEKTVICLDNFVSLVTCSLVRKRFQRAQLKLLTKSSSVICFHKVSKIF